MEILKNFRKHILVTMLALCGLIFVSRPVYAATINLDNSSNRYFSVIGDYPSGYHYVYAYYLNSSVKSSLKPIALTYGSRSFYLILTKASQGTMAVYRYQNGLVAPDGTVDSVCTGSVDVSDIDISSSFISLYDYLGGTSVDGTNSGISFRNYLISKGFSDSDQKKYLSDYKVFSVYSESSPTEYRSSGCTVGLNGLLEVTAEQLFQQLKTAVDTGDDSGLFDQKDDTGGDTSQEPPKFYLKTYNDYGMNKYSEYTLTWDINGSFVDGKESDYGFKVYIAKENKPSDAKVLDSTKISPCLFSANSLVFTWQDVKDLFSFLSTSKLENRFDVFIQITDKSGKAVSDNYIHFLVVKRMEIRDSNYVDKDGNEKKSYGKWENGQFEYTDGRETSAEDKTTNSNGSSTAPSSNVKNDGYTNVENAPSSSNIDASATRSLINSLSTIASTLGDVPALIAKVYSWLPVEIITLIGTGIGLIVIVGIIKWVL